MEVVKIEKLTAKQEMIFDFLKQFLNENGYPPTVREICSGVNLSSPATVYNHLENLERKGYIRKNESKNRAIELLVGNEKQESSMTSTGSVDVPLLGTVTAGNPITAIEHPDEYFPIPETFLPYGKEVFTLRVSGDSMINAGIFDGDIVIIERCNSARNGEMVVALTDEDEVTLKTFSKENGYFRLQPENDTMEPFIFENVTILGKAIGLYRQL